MGQYEEVLGSTDKSWDKSPLEVRRSLGTVRRNLGTARRSLGTVRTSWDSTEKYSTEKSWDREKPWDSTKKSWDSNGGSTEKAWDSTKESWDSIETFGQ